MAAGDERSCASRLRAAARRDAVDAALPPLDGLPGTRAALERVRAVPAEFTSP